MNLDTLKTKIFADGANKAGILELAKNPAIKGFTTNPTLMAAAGITDYEGFCRDLLTVVPDAPISFEVFSDDFDEMARQGRQIASWGSNVYVKIPVTNTEGESCTDLIADLSRDGLRLNVTAILSLRQVGNVATALACTPGAVVSVFAGRIADTGRDPVPLMAAAKALLEEQPKAELLWASPRELLNIFQAASIGCHIITVTHEMLQKLANVGRDLEDYSLDTVRMFFRDAASAGYYLEGIL